MRTLVILLVVLFTALPLHAQPYGGPPPGGGPRMMERIERLKKVRLVEMLDLKEEQSVRFFARLNEHEQAMRALGKEKMEILDRIERLVRNEADAKEFEAIFPEVAGVDDRMGAERKRFFDGLSGLLTPLQRGKYLIFERQFERELREAMKTVRERRREGRTEGEEE
jgi:hypothetical protein